MDLSVIILTYNEELHLERCIASVRDIADKIFIVDSFSSDETVTIAKKMGVEVYSNKWENSYAQQFNWALANLPVKTKWVLRLDADEYITPELKMEIQEKLHDLHDNVSGVVLPLKRVFMGREIKHGVGHVKLMRIFKFGKAACEQRLMDEHIQLMDGQATEFNNAFADHNLNDLAWWSQKHVGYALRETLDLLDIEFGILGHSKTDGAKELGQQATDKRLKKHKYAKMPLFWRSALYFFVRYFLKAGFLDGKEGFLWHFLQGWWYRTLVDAKIFEIKKECGNDAEKIKDFLLQKYNIDCNKVNPFSS